MDYGFTPLLREVIKMRIEHENAIAMAAALGLEQLAVARWRQRSEEAKSTYARAPSLRDCIRELLHEGHGA